MDSRVKQLWIDALEGGEYKQTDGILRKGDEYCCLGVLCDLYIKDTGRGRWDGEQFYTGEYIDGWTERNEVELPTTIQKWAGISSPEGVIDRPVNGFTSLINMNDNGMSFKQIAETIKVQL